MPTPYEDLVTDLAAKTGHIGTLIAPKGVSNTSVWEGTTNGSTSNVTDVSSGGILDGPYLGFNGSTSLCFTGNTNLRVTGAFTMAYSVWIDSHNTNGVISAHGKTLSSNTDAGRGSYSLSARTSQVRLALWPSSGNATLITIDPLTTGAWHRLVATYNGVSGETDNVKLYLNGALGGSSTFTGPHRASTNNVMVGYDGYRSPNNLYFLNGRIALGGHYSVAWNSTDVSNDYSDVTGVVEGTEILQWNGSSWINQDLLLWNGSSWDSQLMEIL